LLGVGLAISGLTSDYFVSKGFTAILLGVGLAISGLTSDYFVSKRFVYNLFGAGFISVFCGELFAGLKGLF
jgi:hypothetical protein